MSDPDDPVQVAWFPSLAASASAVVFGDRALVAQYLPSSSAPAGAFVFDLGHDDRVLPTAYLPLGYSATPPLAAAGAGSYAYVSGGEHADGPGFYVVDVRHPDEPSVLGHFETDSVLTVITHDQAVVYVGDYENVAQQNVLRSVDVSDPLNPVEIGALDLDAVVNEVVVRNGLAYLASGGQLRGLTIVDVSDPAAMAVVGEVSVNLDDPPDHVAIDVGYAFLTTGFELYRVDVSDLANPTVVGPGPVPGPFSAGGMVARWPRVYVMSDTVHSRGVLTAVDYSDPDAPAVLDSLEVDPSQFVQSAGGRLLVPSESGLEVIAIRDTVFNDGFETGDLSSWSGTG